MDAKKFDKEKPQLALLPRHPLCDITSVLMFGAEKYGVYNWRKGMEWNRLASATMRHIMAWVDCEDKDPESGLPHLAHAACNLLFLLEYQRTCPEKDDRYCKEENND